MPYTPPTAEFRFLMEHVVGAGALRGTARFAETTPDVTDAILSEAGRLCAEVMAPLRRIGDTQPARLENGIVRTAPGMADAYRQIARGGWMSVASATPTPQASSRPVQGFSNRPRRACHAVSGSRL